MMGVRTKMMGVVNSDRSDGHDGRSDGHLNIQGKWAL
jgi:hypothetical protein